MDMNRQSFLRGILAVAGMTPLAGAASSETAPNAPDAAFKAPESRIRPSIAMPMDSQKLQKLIDAVPAEAYRACRDGGEPTLPALQVYDDALMRAVEAVRAADVAQHPAVAYVYNMGVLVRTKERFFSIDLCHRRSCELCDALDFALITHNHGDHYTDKFLQDMDRRGKTAITNFDDNYGAYHQKRNPGGFTRGGKTFQLGDVTIRTSKSDHNKYLIDFTMPFEITVGDYTIYHTGDSSKLAKLKPSKAPDLWLVHPRLRLDVVAAAKKFNPKLTALVHLNELGHPKGNDRFPFADGESKRRELEAAGFKAIVPLWGDRLV